MKTTITFRHMEVSEALRNHVNAHLEHLQKFLIKPTECHVILSVEKFRHRAEIILVEQNLHAKADEVSDDMYKTVDLAIAKIENQVKKNKQKIQEHHKHHHSTQEITAQAEVDYEKSRIE